MIRLVLDACVAAKWLLPRDGEDHVPEALALLKAHGDRDAEFVVPESFWAEVGNIFWKAARRGRWTSADAAESLAAFPRTDFESIALEDLLDDAMRIALTYDRSFYDSLYVALAVRMKIPLLTADERLVNALGCRFPVRWLGSFSIT